MKLLIKRDKNVLIPVDRAKASLDDDVPEFLRTPRFVDPMLVEHMASRGSDDDLLIAEQEDYSEIQMHFANQGCPGIWSGYRSALTCDPATGDLYRVKGVSLNPYRPVTVDMDDGMTRIEGGQEQYSAEFEKQMSDRFGETLKSVGIEPVMTVKGMWKYPVKARKTRPVASVVKVLGDTRFDELMHIFSALATHKMPLGDRNEKGSVEFGGFTSEGNKFIRATGNLYEKIGFVSGRLKRLMDKSGQTWSSECEQSNAHYGNIVLYNGTDKLKVGFVDFDASCDASELSASELEDLQKREFQTLRASVMGGGLISPRRIGGKPFSSDVVIGFDELRSAFIRGFDRGYESGASSYTNELDLGDLQEVFALLRKGGLFSHSLGRRLGYNSKLEDYITYADLKDAAKNSYNNQKKLYESILGDVYEKYNNNYIIGNYSKFGNISKYSLYGNYKI